MNEHQLRAMRRALESLERNSRAFEKMSHWKMGADSARRVQALAMDSAKSAQILRMSLMPAAPPAPPPSPAAAPVTKGMDVSETDWDHWERVSTFGAMAEEEAMAAEQARLG